MSKKYNLKNKKGSGINVKIGTPGLREELNAQENARKQATQSLVNDYLANLNDYKFADDETFKSIQNLNYKQVDKLIKTKILLKDLPYKKLEPNGSVRIKVGNKKLEYKNVLYMGKINDTITEIPGCLGFCPTPLQKVGHEERNVYLGKDGNFYLNKFFKPKWRFFPQKVFIEYKNKKPSSIQDPNYSPNNLLVKPQPQHQGPPPPPQYQQEGLPLLPRPQPQAGGFLHQDQDQDPRIYIFSFSKTYIGGNKKPTTKKTPVRPVKKTTTKKPTTKKTPVKSVKKTTKNKPTTKKTPVKKQAVKKPTKKLVKKPTKKATVKKPVKKTTTKKLN